jgi:hypothetical protein
MCEPSRARPVLGMQKPHVLNHVNR